MKNYLPPHDNDSEAGVLCTLIEHPEFELQSENLQPEFFYSQDNSDIYKAIKELVSKGITKIDNITLINQLSTFCKDIDVDKINQIIDNACYCSRQTIAEYKLLVNTVIGLAFKRHAVRKLNNILKKCYECNINDIDDINEEIMDTANGLATDFVTKDKIDSFGKKMDDILARIKEKRNEDGTYGIIPKWGILKNYFTYQDGELILYVARRKQGKSIIAMNECLDKAKAGLAVTYFDTELMDELFFTRLCSHATGIPETKIKSGDMSEEEEAYFNKTFEYIKTLPIVHEYRPKWTREQLVTQAKILHNKGMCDFFIYDYIKSTSGKVSSASEMSQELGIWCNTIKNDILGALGIPGISFAQLNRGMSIADSDGIERYCTAGVMWQHKTKEEIARDGQECGNCKMKVLFNRIGDAHDEDDELDYIDFLFKGTILTIEETKKQHDKDDTPFD